MEKFVKYKDLIYIHCFGPNDDNLTSNKGRYSSNGTSNNAKIFRFNFLRWLLWKKKAEETVSNFIC